MTALPLGDGFASAASLPRGGGRQRRGSPGLAPSTVGGPVGVAHRGPAPPQVTLGSLDAAAAAAAGGSESAAAGEGK